MKNADFGVCCVSVKLLQPPHSLYISMYGNDIICFVSSLQDMFQYVGIVSNVKGSHVSSHICFKVSTAV